MSECVRACVRACVCPCVRAYRHTYVYVSLRRPYVGPTYVGAYILYTCMRRRFLPVHIA